MTTSEQNNLEYETVEIISYEVETVNQRPVEFRMKRFVETRFRYTSMNGSVIKFFFIKKKDEYKIKYDSIIIVC